MKNAFLLLASLIASGYAAHAQVSLIPKGGFTLSTVRLTNNSGFAFSQSEVGYQPGFAAGIGLNVPVASNGFFSVQPELLYLQKGYRVEAAGDEGSTLRLTDAFNYLEVPVLAKINFGTERLKLYVNAGPSVGYALNGRFKQDISGGLLAFSTESKNVFGEEPDNSIGDETYLSPKYYNRVDVGVQFGGGIGLVVGPGMVLLDARYGMGLTNFFKGNPDNSISDDDQPNVQNRVSAFMLGYAIPLGRK
jgi:hypothetical protein